MAQRDQFKVGSAGPGTSASATFNSPTTTGHLIVVVVIDAFSSSLPTYSVSDNKGNSYTSSVSRDDGTNFKVEIFRCANATGGASHQVTVTSGVSHYYDIICIDYSGMVTASEADGTSSNAGISTTPTSGNIVTTATDMILGAFIHNHGGDTPSITEDSGWSLITESLGGGYSVIDRFKVLGEPSTYNAGWTVGMSTAWYAVAAAYKQGAAPPVTVEAKIIIQHA